MCNLKELTDHMIEKAGGRQAAAQLLHVSTQELSLWCSEEPHAKARFIPLDHFLDLSAAAGDMGLKTLARERGFNVTSREIKPAHRISIFQIIGEFSKACGHLAFVVLKSAADGINEAKEINRAARPVIDRMDDIKHAIAQ